MTEHPPATGPDDGRGFEPGRHLSRINGAEYLEVKWRLVWFRERYPNGSIDTELVRLDERQAIFKASITARDSAGKPLGSATGYGSETPNDFRDFCEKAETKAIGRALAALGFGTQFTYDFDFGADQGRVVDAPVHINGGQQRRPQPVRNGDGRSGPVIPPTSGPPQGDASNAPTSRQLSYLRGIARENGVDEAQLDELATRLHGTVVSGLDRRAVSQLIEHVNSLRGNVTNIVGGDQ